MNTLAPVTGLRSERTSATSLASVDLPEAGANDLENAEARRRQEWRAYLKMAKGDVQFTSAANLDIDVDFRVIPGPAVFPAGSATSISLAWFNLRRGLTSQKVLIRDEDAVCRYLEGHADLYEVLEGICQSARNEFGPPASLRLELYRDPEIVDKYLVLYVRLPDYGRNMLQRIRSVSAAHEDELWDKSGMILVTTDYGPVR